MKFISKQMFQNGFNATMNFVKKNSPHILTGTAVVGVGLTSYFAVKGVTRAKDIIREEQIRRKEKLLRDCLESDMYPENENMPPKELIEQQMKIPFKDKVKLVWKPLLPMSIAGATTIACIIGSDVINTGRNAVLLASATALSQGFEEYQKKNVELFGEKNHQKIIDEQAKEAVQNNELLKEGYMIDTGTGDTIILDIENSRPIKGSIENIERAVNEINRQIFADHNAFDYGFRSKNDFYEELGIWQKYFLPKKDDEIGWDKSHPVEIEHSSVLLDDKTPVYAFKFKNKPLAHWQLENMHEY